MANRQPKLILRESCINDLVEAWPVGRFLEAGAGTGYMTAGFLKKGFTGACYELGREARAQLRQNLEPYPAIQVVDDLQELKPVSFDYLFAFEVLEHIEDDVGALRSWAHYLKSRGRLLLSIPAHQRKYGKSDEIVGYVRRYERQQILHLLSDSGFDDVHMVNYGFPISEITRLFSNWLVAEERGHVHQSMEQRSVQNSYRRPVVINRWVGLLSEDLIRPFCAVQRLFYRRDWGDGLVVTARKR